MKYWFIMLLFAAMLAAGCQNQNINIKNGCAPTGYQISIDSIVQPTPGMFWIAGRATYGGSRVDGIFYQALLTGALTCDPDDGAVYAVDGSEGTAIVSGFKPLVRTPRIKGAPQGGFVTGLQTGRHQVDFGKIYLETITLTVAAGVDRVRFDTTAPESAGPKYKVCWTKAGGSLQTIELRPRRTYEITSQAVRDITNSIADGNIGNN